jgi:hypothetical protein
MSVLSSKNEMTEIRNQEESAFVDVIISPSRAVARGGPPGPQPVALY